MDIKTVARHAKVSSATVSRTINGVATVAEPLKARVWKAIRELNYYPNSQARALVSGRSRILGLVVSEITNPFFPELIQSFEASALRRGFEILVASTNNNEERIGDCAKRMIERKVDGVAIMTFGMEAPLVKLIQPRGMRLVTIGAVSGVTRLQYLQVDYLRGIREAVQYLAVLGHRDIAFVSGPLTNNSAQLRLAAFKTALSEIGISAPPSRILQGDYTLEGGRNVMEALLQQKSMPTALICSNDMTAIGVQNAASTHNIRVPQDLSIVGFDDIHIAEFMSPPLTTVRMACTDLAEAAVELLVGPEDETRSEASHISTGLVVRQSTSYPRTAGKPRGVPANTRASQTKRTKISSRKSRP